MRGALRTLRRAVPLAAPSGRTSVRSRCTTDAGPFAEDVFWVLHGAGPPLMVPQSARGSDALLAWLQELPVFDSEAVIAAMSSAGNERFPCWARAADAELGATPDRGGT